ncbi:MULTISPECIES: hybrid sensor histidine kinase/response regulator [Nostocales]|uniref:histidine kinase n=3 Tax=Nostocales TaxID=1161 RepID=A0A0C1R4Y7_9CYAN|nr:ATP-binding protein [Tolypothrix bouteillei]KAF3889120.1 response regulator [Tolypothrix bouteillei VB521301]
MPNSSKLLIIDDCAEDRRIYRRYLLKDPHQSYEILEADSARDGLALSQTMFCDVILLDFCLPDLSGLEILDKLKQEKFEVAPSVIVLSGHGSEEVAAQAIKKGAQDYLVKQRLKPDALQSAVRNAIKRSHSQSQLNKTRERQRLVATTALRIRQSLNLEQILTTTVAEVQQLFQCDRVTIYQFFPQTDSTKVEQFVELCMQEPCLWQEFFENGNLEYQQAIAKVCETGSNLNCRHLFNCQTLDSPSNSQSTCTENFLKLQNQETETGGSVSSQNRYDASTWVIPITLNFPEEPSPKLWGLLVTHHCKGKQQWQNSEIAILKELTVHLALAIQQAEKLSQTEADLAKEKKLNAFKSQIITTVSYEYRTPLAAILAAASTLKQYKNRLDEFKQQKFLQTIEQKARHMTQLVDDLFLFQKFELSQAKFKLQTIDLVHFFSDLIAEQRHKASDRHQLIFHQTSEPKGFLGDGVLLRQIFASLICNAIKYSPDGGHIEISLIDRDSQVIVCVKDEGVGVPIEERENLFQPFCRGSNVETIPGTGLGLAIAKACVELHGGQIVLDSQLGQGTQVTVTLPKLGK